MLRVLQTKKGYGVMLVEELRFLIEGIPHNQAVDYARDYMKLDENAPKKQGRPEKPIKKL